MGCGASTIPASGHFIMAGLETWREQPPRKVEVIAKHNASIAAIVNKRVLLESSIKEPSK